MGVIDGETLGISDMTSNGDADGDVTGDADGETDGDKLRLSVGTKLGTWLGSSVTLSWQMSHVTGHASLISVLLQTVCLLSSDAEANHEQFLSKVLITNVSSSSQPVPVAVQSPHPMGQAFWTSTEAHWRSADSVGVIGFLNHSQFFVNICMNSASSSQHLPQIWGQFTATFGLMQYS